MLTFIFSFHSFIQIWRFTIDATFIPKETYVLHLLSMTLTKFLIFSVVPPKTLLFVFYVDSFFSNLQTLGSGSLKKQKQKKGTRSHFKKRSQNLNFIFIWTLRVIWIYLLSLKACPKVTPAKKIKVKN